MDDAIVRLLTRKNADGAFVYSDMEVSAFVIVLVKNSQQPVGPSVRRYLNGFLSKIGVVSTDTPEVSAQKIDTYFEKNPMNPHLLKEIERLVREAKLSGRDVSDSVARFLGAERRSAPKLGAPRTGASPLSLLIKERSGE